MKRLQTHTTQNARLAPITSGSYESYEKVILNILSRTRHLHVRSRF